MAYENEDEKPKLRDRGEARPNEGEMDEDEFQNIVSDVMQDAEQFVDGELSPDRAEATDYYMGRPFGNEEEGRSQVVITEVRDGVKGVLPAFMRVIHGPENIVEFVPDNEQAIEKAQIATEVVRKIYEGSDGFIQTHSVVKDGLVRKIGIYKWGWDDSETIKAYHYTGLTEEQITLLDQEDNVTVVKVEPGEQIPGQPLMDPQTGQPIPGEPIQLFDVDLTRRQNTGRVFVMAVPPEEFIFSREGRSVGEAQFVGHRMLKTRGELIALGYDEDEIDEFGDISASLSDSEEVDARAPFGQPGSDPESGDANDKILFVEGYMKIDYDGDGIAELRKVCAVGPTFHVVSNHPVASRPFSLWSPDPEPHTIVGLSYADLLMDLQDVESSVVRAQLDSLAASIFPRTAYVDGQVSVEDILNTAMGAPIRTNAPGMIQEIAHTFVGKEAFPMLEFFMERAERRTGQAKGGRTLDMDALQSTEKAAAKAAIDSATAQQDLLVRLFAEQAFKPMFKGVLQLLVQHQNEPRMMKVRDRWMMVDPAVWRSDWDVQVNVALGSGTAEAKIAVLTSLAGEQFKLIEALGPDNDLTSIPLYRNTLAKITRLSGQQAVDEFWKPIDPMQFEQKMAMQAQQPPPPTPEQITAQAMVEIERMKAEKQLAIEAEKLKLERMKMELEDDRERDKHAADITVQLQKIQAEYGVKLNQLEIDSQMESQRILLENDAYSREVDVIADTERHRTMTKAMTDAHAAELAAESTPTE